MGSPAKNLRVPKRNAKMFSFNPQDAQTTTTISTNDMTTNKGSPIQYRLEQGFPGLERLRITVLKATTVIYKLYV